METNFLQTLEENKNQIFRICKIYAISPIEPQDLFQEVAFQFWRSLPNFKGKSNINTWIYRIAINVCYSSKNKLEKKNKQTIQLDSIQFLDTKNDSEELEQEKYIALKECIALLKDIDKTIVVLYLEELPYKEIAEITGLTENNIAVKIKRIKKILLKCITPKIK